MRKQLTLKNITFIYVCFYVNHGSALGTRELGRQQFTNFESGASHTRSGMETKDASQNPIELLKISSRSFARRLYANLARNLYEKLAR